jgi:hypothetical protein
MKTKPKKRFVMYLDESDFDQLALKARATHMDLSPFAASLLVPMIRADAANDGLEKLLPQVSQEIKFAVNKAVFNLRKLLVFSAQEAYVASLLVAQVLAYQEGMTTTRMEKLYDEARSNAARQLRGSAKDIEGLLEEIDANDPLKIGKQK